MQVVQVALEVSGDVKRNLVLTIYPSYRYYFGLPSANIFMVIRSKSRTSGASKSAALAEDPESPSFGW